ncbi:MAG: nitroreductase family protein [Raoultibacter sp.]
MSQCKLSENNLNDAFGHASEGVTMSFLELAKKRCSIRAFQDKAVEPEKLNVILEAARVAPTACNRQPVRLLVVQSAESRALLSQAGRTFEAPLVIVVCADRDTAWTRPHDGMKTTDIDASILTDHMMLAATDLGLGSVWICAFDPKALREAFELPDNLEPINLLAIGYADGDFKNPNRHDKERKALADIVSFDVL